MAPVVADYSRQIGNRMFGSLFRKLGHNAAWGDASFVEWIVITKETLAVAKESSQSISSLRLNSHIQKRGESSEKTKLRSLRDTDDNLGGAIVGSGIPLGG